MIYYLVYLSSATRLYTENDLSQILASSRKNNTAKDVTGILLYHEGSIIQVLEGDKEVVNNLYFKIKDDKRHHTVIRMIEGMHEERNFSDWSMGFKALSNKEWKEYSGYLSLNPAALISMLKRGNLKIDTLVTSFLKHSVR